MNHRDRFRPGDESALSKSGLLSIGAALAAFVVLSSSCSSLARAQNGDKPPETASVNISRIEKFLDGLWSRGYFELADQYLAETRTAGKVDGAILDWLEARSDFENASIQVDLARRKGLLERSISKMKAVLPRLGDSSRAIDARSALVRALVELAHLFKLESADRPTASQKEAQLRLSRARFGEARDTNVALDAAIVAKEKTFVLPVLRDDPRRPDFETTQLQRLNSQIQSALIDYEEAQTWPAKSPQQVKLLEKSAETLKSLYENNRQQVAGQNARLWQARCLQELGKLGEASGVYGEIIDQLDPALKTLRRRAQYFRITAYRDREEHALAADEARRWLDANPDQLRTDDGLGVQLELARNILAQLPKAGGSEKAAGERIARERLNQVVRVYSRHQPEARALLDQIRKTTTETPSDRLDATAALAAGQEALELKDYARAEACFAVAARKTSPGKDKAGHVKARYFQAVAAFRGGRYYEAYVLGSHVAARFPSEPLAANAAEVALAAMTYAYNSLKSVDPQSDLSRLTALADSIRKSWPGTSQADSARITLAEIARGQGRYSDAVADLEAVPATSDQYAEARSKLGLVLWRIARSGGTAEKVDTTVPLKARRAFEASIEKRTRDGVPADDPKLIETRLDLADLIITMGRFDEALDQLAGLEEHLEDAQETLASRARRLKVKALIAADRLDQALDDLARAESSGQSADELTALYFQLGQSLQDVLKELKLNADGRYVRVRQTYGKFLKALASSKAGDSWEAMQWVAEAQLEDGQAADALKTLRQIDAKYLSRTEFSNDPENGSRLVRSQLKIAEAARKSRDFAAADTALAAASAKNANLLPVLMEKGHLLSDRGKSTEAFSYWRNLATRLGTATPRPEEYYECWLEVAKVLEKQGKASTARQTLAGIVRLNGSKMPAEWKSRLEAEMSRLARPGPATTSKKGGS